MPTLEEHWRIVELNMQAIKEIIDGMEAMGRPNPIRCYSCDTILYGLTVNDGFHDYCSPQCRDEKNCGAAEHKRQVEDEEEEQEQC